ncbi:MAG: DUF3291 domain-containing protein [Chloroflexota bacterium]
MSAPVLAMWWIRAGDIPTIQDAKIALEMLKEKGATSEAFTFSKMFPPPQ